ARRAAGRAGGGLDVVGDARAPARRLPAGREGGRPPGGGGGRRAGRAPLPHDGGARAAGGPRAGVSTGRVTAVGPTRRRARRPQPRWSLRARVRPAARTAYRRLGDLGRRLLGPGAGAAPAGPDPETPPWLPLPPGGAATCTVCRGQGDAFDGPAHVELSVFPRCGANGRDRFLHWRLARRVPPRPHPPGLEGSPPPGPASRPAMTSLFFYP